MRKLCQKVVYIYCDFPGSHGWFGGSQVKLVDHYWSSFSCRFDDAFVSQPIICHPCRYLITNLPTIRRLFCSLAVSACCYCNYGARFQRARHNRLTVWHHHHHGHIAYVAVLRRKSRQLHVLPLLYVIYINPAADGFAYVQFPLRLACEKLLAALRSRVVSCFRLYILNFSCRDVPM